MEFIETIFKGAWIIKPKVFGDNRGFFLETFSQKWLEEKGIKANFVQDNHSKSALSGTLRGLHFQSPPYTQAKMARVIKGAVYDVIVDLRGDSETYGKWQGFELSEDNFNILYVPRGFAHGFCSLKPDTEFLYKVDNFYTPEYDSGIIWNDPDLKINWPVKDPILSEKDKKLQNFRDFKTPFKYNK